MPAEALKKLKAKAAKYCSTRERASSEVYKKLVSWGAEEIEAESILTELRENDFVNDHRFCSAYSNDKFRFNKWGKRKIKFQLRNLGFEDGVIGKGLESIDNREYIAMIDGLIANKRKQLGTEKTDFVKKQKTISFLVQKGFEFDIVSQRFESGDVL